MLDLQGNPLPGAHFSGGCVGTERRERERANGPDGAFLAVLIMLFFVSPGGENEERRPSRHNLFFGLSPGL